jgi:hypothetical protein
LHPRTHPPTNPPAHPPAHPPPLPTPTPHRPRRYQLCSHRQLILQSVGLLQEAPADAGAGGRAESAESRAAAVFMVLDGLRGRNCSSPATAGSPGDPSSCMGRQIQALRQGVSLAYDFPELWRKWEAPPTSAASSSGAGPGGTARVPEPNYGRHRFVPLRPKLHAAETYKQWCGVGGWGGRG